MFGYELGLIARNLERLWKRIPHDLTGRENNDVHIYIYILIVVL